MKLSILIILGLIPSLLAKCSFKAVKEPFKISVNDFTANFLPKISQEYENHFVTSPLSIWMLLATAALGATGTTLEEIKRVLAIKDNKCMNHNNFINIASAVASDNDTQVILKRTSNIYVDENLIIINKFKNKLSKIGVTKLEALPFSKSDAAAKIINDNVSRATNNTINSIVSPEDLQNVLMIIIDTIYFKGSWKTPFLSEDTEVDRFYYEDGTGFGEVNMMTMSNPFNIKSMDSINATVLEMPYGNNDKYSMLLFLPYTNVSLNSVINNLNRTNITGIYKEFEEFDEDTVIVRIPRFEIKSDLHNLKELMIGMGLKSMFDSAEASFTSLSHSPLYVTNLIQKANIEVTEEGTVASAATEAEMAFKSMPNEFIANKPFLFMIVDKEIQVPLFTGAYSKPTLF